MVEIADCIAEVSGLKVWLDRDRLTGNITEQMCGGIDNSDLVVVFVTERYENKIIGANDADNCKLEFQYSALKKTSKRMLAVIMEDSMKDQTKWKGILALHLGPKLSFRFRRNADLVEQCQQLADQIKQIIAEECPESPFSLTGGAVGGGSAVGGGAGGGGRATGAATGGEFYPCAECGNRAVFHCPTCGADFCEADDAAVHRPRVHQTHIRCAVAKKPKAPLKCQKHRQDMLMFCREVGCRVPACILCNTIGDHKGHDCQMIEDVCEAEKTILLAKQVIALLTVTIVSAPYK